MPCRCDYMEHTDREIESSKVAEHLVYLETALGIEPDPKVRAVAGTYYGSVAMLDEMTAKLCARLGSLGPEQSDVLLYDGRNAQARKLATWWEDHQKADARRDRQERGEPTLKTPAAEAETALESLSDEVRDETGKLSPRESRRRLEIFLNS